MDEDADVEQWHKDLKAWADEVIASLPPEEQAQVARDREARRKRQADGLPPVIG